jgi:MFS family permease
VYRLTTLGIIILMTIVAFEAMAVATALPTAARSLDGLGAYGWCFTGFLVASVIGMVSSGMYSDLRGPRTPTVFGLALFIGGLLLGSGAGQMWVLVLARVVQGLATGLLITAMYVVIGEVYSDAIRPRIFAALASAWVVPGLVGPIVAGWITQQLSWRWVFGGLAPFVAIGGLMMLPSLRQLRTQHAHGALANPRRIGYAVLSAAGIAAIANLGENLSAGSLVLAILGAALMIIGMRQLLPKGTIGFAAGVPAAVAYRGVLAGTFFGMESIVPLTLTQQHNFSPTMSGLPLMLSAVSWAIGSQIQGRLRHPNRSMLVASGLVLMACAGVGMALVATHTAAGWGAFLFWPLAGLGAGLALTTASVSLLEFTNDADRGSDSAALQLSDSSVSALCTAFSGALVAAAAHGRISYSTGMATVFLVPAVFGLLSIMRTGRLNSAAVPAGVRVSPGILAP